MSSKAGRGAGSVDEGRGVASAGEATSSEAEAIVWRCGPSAFFFTKGHSVASSVEVDQRKASIPHNIYMQAMVS